MLQGHDEFVKEADPVDDEEKGEEQQLNEKMVDKLMFE